MIRFRYITISSIGISYLFILLFITVGAVMRNVNLLYVLAGLMFAPLVLNWRYAIASLQGLVVKRRFTDLMTAGSPLVVDFDVKNTRSRLDSWSIWVRDRVTKKDTNESAKVSALVPTIESESESSTSYKCFLPIRGVYQLGPLRVSTRFPLGLVLAWSNLKIYDEVFVAPRLGTMHARWQRIAFGDQRIGIHTAGRHKHNEGEFYAVRHWQSGDSRRWIHWRTSAKLNELAVRQFEKRGDGGMILLLDFWHPETQSKTNKSSKKSEPNVATNVVEYAASLFGSAVSDSLERQIKLIVCLASDDAATISDSTHRDFLQTVLRKMATMRAVSETKLKECLKQVSMLGEYNSRLVVISSRSQNEAGLQKLLNEERGMSSQLKNMVWVDVSKPEYQDLVAF